MGNMVILPNLTWEPTKACGNRHGHPVNLVVVHRWGTRFVNMGQEARAYHGVVNYLKDSQNGASAHIVYPGSAVPGEATQMVAWDDYAWAEAAYNPVSDDIESADAIWLGKDPLGMKGLARIVAQRVHARGLPPVWSTHRGFCRHADLGQAGGGHTQCPTTDLHVWKTFVRMVQDNLPWDGRKTWGR